jgi:chitinase
LHDQSSDPEPGWSLDGCAKNWVALGAPREKMNVGLAFYGRSFRGATELGTPHGGADDSSWTLDEGSPQYFVSLGRGGGGGEQNH